MIRQPQTSQKSYPLNGALFALSWALMAAALPILLFLQNKWLALAAFLVGAGLLVLSLLLDRSYALRPLAARIIRYTLLVFGMLVMVFPFFWMLSSSLKTYNEMNYFPPTMFPQNWANFENFKIVFEKAPFARYFLNSVLTVLGSVGVTTFTTILAAFAFSRLEFRGREILFSLLLSMMMVPFEMLVITNFQTIVKLGVYDTLYALIIPFTSSIFYTYILRNFFQSIPSGLYWSARVDGCTNWKYLWKVMVPIARPSLVTIVLLNALASWNSFMWPLLVIKSDLKRTLPFGLYHFTTEVGANFELLMAASTVTVLPMIILFLFARKQIIRGVARGGIKG